MQNEYKDQVAAYIDEHSQSLWEISTAIFNQPEIAFKEYKACQLLTKSLNESGFVIETRIGNLETAFRASFGEADHPIIAILAEYDALPGLGHACGHNLIASASLGAGMALAAILPVNRGRIQVIGTPAEEGGGGKILLANAGIFNDIDAAMMFHPASKNLVLRKSLASSRLSLEFFGKASHAAAAPEEGINALDAMILTFNNINALRQVFTARDRVAGVISHGGEAANIVPAYTSAEFSIRSHSSKRRDILVEKVIACAAGAAKAVGCRLEYKIKAGYKEILPNRIIAERFQLNLERLGRVVVEPDLNERMGSTDMGDVSHLVPSIHPYLAIAPENVAGHTLEFKDYCISDAGKSAMLDAAKALAMTAVDLITNPDLLNRAREELQLELYTAG